MTSLIFFCCGCVVGASVLMVVALLVASAREVDAYGEYDPEELE